MLVVRLNQLTAGGSGVRPELVAALAAVLRADALPPVLDAVQGFLPWFSGAEHGVGYKAQASVLAYQSARLAALAFAGSRRARPASAPAGEIVARTPHVASWYYDAGNTACGSFSRSCGTGSDGCASTSFGGTHPQLAAGTPDGEGARHRSCFRSWHGRRRTHQQARY